MILKRNKPVYFLSLPSQFVLRETLGFGIFILFFTLMLTTGCAADTTQKTNQPVLDTKSFPLSETQLRDTMKEALKQFNTPSVSINISYNGKQVFNGAEGKRHIEKDLDADENTYYRLASVSKAFTAAALGVLVDEGKLTWDDKVIDHLPEFVMQDPWVTREFTIKDLLSHRSGLVSAAGDSMIWPEPSGFSRSEVVHNLRYLTPEYSFRNRYAYSNVLYITAGELVSRVSGQTFDSFVEEKIFKPLGMNCFVGDIPEQALQNVSMSYGFNDTNGIYQIPRNSIQQAGLMSAAAGGMVCNAAEMNKWLQALLTKRNLPFSEAVLEQMWSPQTILSVSELDEEWDGTLFRSYGLGWRLSNLYEHKMISHTGTLSGYQAYVALIPDFGLAVSILNNGSNYGVRGSLMQTIIKSVLAAHKGQTYADDWVEQYVQYQEEQEANYLARNIKEPQSNGKMTISGSQIIGRYKDTWFGEFTLSKLELDSIESASLHSERKIRITHNKMKTLVGSVQPFENNSWRVVWDNKNAQRDAFLHFQSDVSGNVIGMSMHPFVEKERTSHEYRDMFFKRIGNN